VPTPAGTVFVDDIDVRDWNLHELRKAPGGIGVVPEDGFLFSATIRDNLTFGIGAVDDATVEKVIDLVDLRRDIERLPDGMNTMVGERGVTLSGGQRQRVALGRAILSRPAILLLDDSLSAVDVETEQNIIAALAAADMKTTVIMVSHRLSVLRGADEIVGLADGRVVERGSHSTLLNSAGLYAALWGEQERQAALQARLQAEVQA
jgi:ATP-binding cassette subfamily B protein